MGWTPSDPLTFGQRLALVRQRHAWNIKQAAGICGVDPESWRAWETQGRNPRGFEEVCAKIADASRVDYVWLATGVLPRLDSNQEPSDYPNNSQSNNLLTSVQPMKLGSINIGRRNRNASEDWEASLVAAGRKESTVKLRRYYLGRFAAAIGKAPERASRAEVVEWLAAGEWSASTRRSVMASLAEFYKWAQVEGVRRDNPMETVARPAEPRPCPKPMPENVLREALARFADDPNVWLLRLAASTGLRRAELARVHSGDLEDAGLRVVGKGGVVRVVPLPDDLREWIAEQDGWCFPSPRGGHIQPDAVAGRIERMTGYSPHTLRHRYATQVYAATRDLRAVQTLLGHASVATTQRYVGVGEDAVKIAAASGWVA